MENLVMQKFLQAPEDWIHKFWLQKESSPFNSHRKYMQQIHKPISNLL